MKAGGGVSPLFSKAQYVSRRRMLAPDLTSTDDIAHSLRTHFPEYRRSRFDAFKRFIQKTETELVPIADDDGEQHQKKKEDKDNKKKITTKENENDQNDEVKKNNNEGVRFKDLRGMKELLMEVEDTVIVPLLKHKKLVDKGIELRMGNILFHGPPGCGKTTLARAIANESSLPLYELSSSGIDESREESLRKLFLRAYKTAPSIIFIDEIDLIASKRDDLQQQSDRRIVTQLMSCMDECHRRSLLPTSHEDSCYVLVIGATNRPHALDPAFRRPGRFEKEIPLGVPDENARFDILCRKLKLPPHHHQAASSLDILKIARSTPGFVPADFDSLISEAYVIALQRAINIRKPRESRDFSEDDGHRWWRETWLDDAIDNLTLTMTGVEEAITKVQPSSKREGFSEIPDYKWEDIGGLHDIKQEFERSLINCIKYPEHTKRCGRAIETGILLFGPKGCGKTSIAKAVANEARANFIHIQGPELLDKYVGESERAIRTLFSRARTCSPCIIFFDEIDGMTEKREFQKGRVVQQLVTQLLTELDGRDKRNGVFVIGATNRIDKIDEALLRPGRFCKRLYVPLPGPDERGMILKALGKERPIDPTVNLIDIAKMEACENFNGSDLYHLMREATLAARDEAIANSSISDTSQWTVKVKHFEQVVTTISPSVSKEERKLQWRLAKRFMACNLRRNTTEGHSE